MFLRKAALRPVPPYAIVDQRAIELVEHALEEQQDQLQGLLDAAYRELDRQHPALAAWLAEQVSHQQDEIAQSLGYFLAVTVFMAFREGFPTRLSEVDDNAIRLALDTLEADEEIRANDPAEVFESDDVIAMGQPTLVEFVQHHFHHVLEQSGPGAELEDLHRVYRTILVEVIALSHAVNSPQGTKGPPKEALA